MKLKDLTTPAFVINRHAFEGNCRSMLDMVRKRKLKIRPHIKSHKTREGALIQAGDGIDSHVTGFVASTLPEINMLVDAVPRYGGPFRDVLYGVPISESKLETLDSLRRKVIPDDGQIHILIDHPVQVAFVEKYVETSPDKVPFSAFLKLDTGYHRAGITCDDRGVDLAVQILQSPHLGLTGVYSHWYVIRHLLHIMWLSIVDLASCPTLLVVMHTMHMKVPSSKRLRMLTFSKSHCFSNC